MRESVGQRGGYTISDRLDGKPFLANCIRVLTSSQIAYSYTRLVEQPVVNPMAMGSHAQTMSDKELDICIAKHQKVACHADSHADPVE
jgi:hypothetical protein